MLRKNNPISTLVEEKLLYFDIFTNKSLLTTLSLNMNHISYPN